MLWEECNGRNSEFGGGLFREVVIYEINGIFCVWLLVRGGR